MKKLEVNRFEWVGTNVSEQEKITRPSTNYLRDGLNRLRKNKAAIFSIVVITFIVLLAIIIPMVMPYEISEQHLTNCRNQGLFFTSDTEDGHLHLLGTDKFGRDTFVRICYGGRISLFIALAVVCINFIIGVVYGGISGYLGGFVDNIMMRVIEVINGIPFLIIVILLMMIMPPGVLAIIVAYAATGWTSMARMVRGQVMSLKEQEFIIAGQSMGAKPMRIILKHLVPNTLSIVIVQLTLEIPSVIFTEATLSFLGLGVPVPLASWGTLANDAVKVFQSYPMQLIIPALCISMTMLAFNLLGDGLRDAFDPKLRR